MSAIDQVDSGQPMARIADLRVVGRNRIEVTWASGDRAGYTDRVDLWPAISTYKVYRPLRQNDELFATARLADEGNLVIWDGSDLEMSADLVETLAEESMSSAEFAAFLERNRLTQNEAAALLGRSRRQIGYYLNPGPVPRIVWLACLGYEWLVRERKRPAA